MPIGHIPLRLGALVMLAAVVLDSACDRGGQQEGLAPMNQERESALRRQMDAEFVVFSRQAVVISALESPVDVPVTIGSRPSKSSLISSNAEVLSIDDRGRMVAHRAGSARVRSRSNDSSLDVSVIIAETIRVVPAELNARPHETVPIQVRLPDGTTVPPDAVEWMTSAPEIAVASGGDVYTRETPGQAVLTARYGGATSTAVVQVGDIEVGALHVTPERPKVRLGSLVSFQVRSRSGPVNATWSTSSETAVAHLDENVFQATAVGGAQVCARHGERVACTKVEVMP
jgi:hypothetical protein